MRSVCTTTASSNYTNPIQYQTRCESVDDPGFDPIYADRITATAARLFWQNRGIKYAVRWKAVGSTDWTLAQGVMAMPYSITGLSSGTNYEVQVQNYCSADVSSDFSSSYWLRTLSACAPPTTLSNTTTAQTTRLTWAGATTATVSYELRWRPRYSQWWTTETSLTTPAYSVTGLAEAVVYEWQVRQFCSATDASAFTPSRTFSTSLCQLPSLFIGSKWPDLNVTLSYLEPSASADIRWRPDLATTWTAFSGIVSSFQSQTALTLGSTYRLEWRQVCSLLAQSDYSGAVVTPRDCSSLYSVRDGNWDDPGVWSCVVPTALDDVRLKHVITLRPGAVNTAHSVRYDSGGRLVLLRSASLKLWP